MTTAAARTMAHPLFVLNGLNLNMLGKREPHLYGTTTMAEVQARTEALAAELGLECSFRQTNHEGVLVDWIQEAYERMWLSSTRPASRSAACRCWDALKRIRRPLVEVHITNIHQRPLPYAFAGARERATWCDCGGRRRRPAGGAGGGRRAGRCARGQRAEPASAAGPADHDVDARHADQRGHVGTAGMG